MTSFSNHIQLLKNIRNNVAKLTGETEICTETIRNDFEKFNDGFIRFFTETHTLDVCELFEEIEAIRKELRHVKHTVPARRNFLETLTVVIALLDDLIKPFACTVTDIFVENILFSVEESTKEYNNLFIDTIRNFSFYLSTLKDYCGVEMFFLEIVDAIEKTAPYEITENDENDEETLLEKHCVCLKFYELLLNSSATFEPMKKYLVKKSVPIAFDILNGKDGFPFNKYPYLKTFSDLMITLARKVNEENFDLNGLANDLRLKTIKFF